MSVFRPRLAPSVGCADWLPQRGSNVSAELAATANSSPIGGFGACAGRPRNGGGGLAAAVLLASAALLPTLAHADPTTTTVSDVIVTATRLPAPVDLTPGAYVITDKDIAQRQATFAADVLNTVPSLSVFSEGAFGGLTSVRQRGASSDQTLVLVDGMPVNDASQPEGGFDFSAIDLADIKRVEVLNGPQSSIWGSDAIGGVISFTTKEPTGVGLNAETGAYGTTRLSGSVGVANDRWALGASAASFDTNGISAADARFGNTEPDGDREITASLRGRFTINPIVEIDGQVRVNQSRTDIDGFPPPNFILGDTNDVSDSRSLDAYLRAKVTGPFGLNQELSVSHYTISRGDSGDSGPFGFDASRDVYRWTVTGGDVKDGLSFIGGAERDNTDASLSTGAHSDLGESSVFLAGQWRPIERLTTSASIRYDDPDKYHGQVTARLGAGYEIGGGVSVVASYGQGFKTPTISETVCDFCTPMKPSVGLQPEHAEGEDLGLVWRPNPQVSVRVTAFNLNVRDEIVFSGFNGPYVNLPSARSRGVEAELEAALGWGFSLQASYSHDDAIDESTGRQQLRVPKDMASGGVFWTGGKTHLGLTVRDEASQPDTDQNFNPIARPGFTVANLTGSYDVTKHLTLTARVENLGGAHYEETYGFGEPGRSVYVGFKFKD
jgi:vitamin B12 transporter